MLIQLPLQEIGSTGGSEYQVSPSVNHTDGPNQAPPSSASALEHMYSVDSPAYSVRFAAVPCAAHSCSKHCCASSVECWWSVTWCLMMLGISFPETALCCFLLGCSLFSQQVRLSRAEC